MTLSTVSAALTACTAGFMRAVSLYATMKVGLSAGITCSPILMIARKRKRNCGAVKHLYLTLNDSAAPAAGRMTFHREKSQSHRNLFECGASNLGMTLRSVISFLRECTLKIATESNKPIERLNSRKAEYESDFRIVLPDGTIRIIHSLARPIVSESGDIVEFVGATIDITERKQAEEEHKAHLWFLESMDQVNRAIQGTNDLEQMMSDMLDAVLSIFNCDRAWLVYPCDPETSSWKVPMEHARPEFPGLFVLGLDLPVDPEIAKVFHSVRASSGPVRFGPGSEDPLPAEAAKRFSIQSMIGMAIYPKGDKPYMLGLHQCSYPRVWTPQEERLFQEIGRRLEDELTSLLMFRNLGESERKLEEAQRLAHVGYWERDPDTDLITWSNETYRIFGLQPQERILYSAQLPELVHPEDKQLVVEAVAEALRGGRRYDVEYRVVRPTGEVRLVHSQGDVIRDESGRPRRMFGTVQDITERKQAEQRLMAQHTVTQVLAAAATLEEATAKILQAVCECLVWDVGALWSIDKEAGVLRCVEVWHKESIEVPDFEAASRETTFIPGIGLPGRVWFSREPMYIPDVVRDANFPRAPIAAREVLHAAFGFPILLGGEVLGVMEFFQPRDQAARSGLARHDGYHRQPDRPVHRTQARRRSISHCADGVGSCHAGGDAGRDDCLDRP